MSDDSFDVMHMANLARLDLSAEQAATFQPQINAILGYIESLNALDTENIEPTAHAADLYDVMREDQARPGIKLEAFLKNTPDQVNGQLRVPQIMENN